MIVLKKQYHSRRLLLFLFYTPLPFPFTSAVFLQKSIKNLCKTLCLLCQMAATEVTPANYKAGLVLLHWRKDILLLRLIIMILILCRSEQRRDSGVSQLFCPSYNSKHTRLQVTKSLLIPYIPCFFLISIPRQFCSVLPSISKEYYSKLKCERNRKGINQT